MPVTSTDVIERTVHINAKPETVFAFLSNPDRLSGWAGRSTTMDPRPGGLFRIDYNGFDIMRGQFVEVTPPSRIVFTWGWESLGDQTRPGASTVTVTLEPEGDGTRLRLVHEGLAAMDVQPHSEGWDFFLSRLGTVAEGGTVEPFAPPLNESEEYASRLNTLLCELRTVLEEMPADRWTAMTGEEGRTVSMLAAHAAGHTGLAFLTRSVVLGEDSPVFAMTPEQMEVGNREADRANAGIAREQVLADLRAQGPAAVEIVKAFSSADLDAARPMAFAGGQPVPVRMLLQGPLLTDLADHLAHI
ncbi:MAG: SRPBCC family protein, partial [Anaerolineales bacterium]